MSDGVTAIKNQGQLDADVWTATHGGNLNNVIVKYLDPVVDPVQKGKLAHYIADRVFQILEAGVPK